MLEPLSGATLPPGVDGADPMAQALSMAWRALRITNPNPRVGCVLVSSDGRLIGQGHTQKVGSAHAEVMALRDAAAAGATVAGATAYVTLEPCSHHGRTPPCCDALISAQVARVVVATIDPYPLVCGQGVARLRDAGIRVDVLAPDSAPARASRELNIGFFSRIRRGRPWVRLKTAASLDGGTALGNGQSQWITGPQARADGHAWRARACAVLTGIGTVLQDDPMLDVRLTDTPRQPHLVVVDSRLQTPTGARLFQPAAHGLPREIWVVGAVADPARQAALEALGAQVTLLPGANGKVDLSALLEALAARGVNELHLEAGDKLNGSWVREDLVDEWLLYLAPRLLGAGTQGIARFGPLDSLEQAPRLHFQAADAIGPDLRLLARVEGRDSFLHP